MIVSSDVTVDQATSRVVGLDFQNGGTRLRLRAELASDGRAAVVDLMVAGQQVPATLVRM